MLRTPSHIRLCAWLVLLGGCGARVIEPEPGGEAGTGGRGGADGSAGASGAGDAGNGGGSDASVGGAGTNGGTGGVLGGTGGEAGGAGGAGGVAGDCATSDPAATCSQLAQGWFAVKIALDVWWPGTPVLDPGRGDIELVLRARIGGDACAGDDATAELQLCDVKLPIATSDVECDAYELSFDESIWDSPGMPRFVTTAQRALLSPGEILSLTPWLGLLGLDLADAAGALPAAEQREMLSCADGTGISCFLDHDLDELPGITMIARNDKATYVGPYGDGLCTSGLGYRFAAVPAMFNLTGIYYFSTRATRAQIGMRAHAGVAAEIADDCMSAVGDSTSESFELRAAGCEIDPDTLDASDPRVGEQDFGCTDAESIFVDETLPAYRVLRAREAPTDSMLPLSWVMTGRDIPKTPSFGPRSALVHLAELGEAEPSCATVRSSAFPDL